MNRDRALRRAGLLVLAINVALAVAKGAVYLSGGSLAVGSEAVNSGADAVYSVVVVAGLYLTTRPADRSHPHGHERIEPFVALAVGVAILAAGGSVLWRAVESVLTTPEVTVGPLAAGVLLASAAVKYALYRYCLSVGRDHNSPGVSAMAADNRTDVLTAGAALAGVVGAALGFPVLDPLAGGVVALGILYTGVEILRDNVHYLVGRAPPDDLRADIIARAVSHPEVEGVHDVVAHYVGPEVDVSLHIEVEGDRTLAEAHDIETDVASAIRDIDEVDDVFVHLDPKELGEWKDGDDAVVTPDPGPSGE